MTNISPPPGGAKRGRIEGAAVSKEVLESSASILQTGRSGTLRGLQQFYSPPEAAALIAKVQGSSMVTLDLTAGDGALLAGVARHCRFGVEIDADQIEAGSYTAIRGDVQRVYPLLRTLGVEVARIAANPPFGLDWTAPTGKCENSTIATWRMSHTLLAEDGAGAFIAGRDRFLKDVLSREDASGVYAVVECSDLFEGVEMAVVIAFFVKAGKRTGGSEVLRITSSRADLQRAAGQIIETREAVCERVGAGRFGAGEQLRQVFAQVDEVLATERARSDRDGEVRFDLELAGQRLRLRLTPWAKLVLAQRRVLRNVERLNRQNVAYFALNAKEWRLLEQLAHEQVMTLDPTLVERVEEVIGEAAVKTCPLYAVRPQQRLAYLDDLDLITCTTSDPERGFEQGQSYPLRTFSEVQTKQAVEGHACAHG